MSLIHELLEAHPQLIKGEMNHLVSCVQECIDTQTAAVICSDACIKSENPDLIRSSRICLDLSDILITTSKMLSRPTEPDWSLVHVQLETTIEALQTCGVECGEFGQKIEFCRLMAEACSSCKETCERLVETLFLSA